MKVKIHVIDAFTEEQFKGNSAAVIITEEWLPDSLMQSIAIENNLSETAFLVKQNNDIYQIRWFSPITEIDFCGHATLASAFVLFSDQPTLEKVVFSAKAVGSMTISKAANGDIQMEFPNRKPVDIETIPEQLMKGLSIKPFNVLRSDQAYFAIYNSESDVLNISQNNELLKQLAPYDVVVTAKSDSEQYDFVSRYFWPANGGDEDPVTGSIHTGLAPYWSEQLDKDELLAFQASKRGGVLLCKVESDKVILSGKAVRYLEGFIDV